MWSCVGAYVVAEVKDVKGKTRFKLKQPSRSFLRNFGRALFGAMHSTANSEVTKLVNFQGNSYTYPKLSSTSSRFMGANGAAGEKRCGIAVGSGTKAVEFTDYKLDSIIEHGTGSGQLYYNISTVHLIEGSDYSIVRFARSFDNQSGGNVTVTETGLFIIHEHADVRGVRALVARDLLETAITLAPGETLNVRYEIEIVL